ncbi:MAG: class I SAM-dependent methyltransferase [Solirubrobacteraceae bacterium]|nr:class I SAM-dependent methyltransferase [Solirubrobacteraceae bacterium]
MSTALTQDASFSSAVMEALPPERGLRGLYVRAVVSESRPARAVRFTAKRALRPTYARSLSGFAHLYEVGHLLNSRGLVGLGVEVGVKRGRTSEAILEAWSGRRLISIDPWAEAPAEEYHDTSNVVQAEHDGFYAMTQERLARFGDRSEIWRMTGMEGAKRVEDRSLDFAFIDARHDYASVIEDLEAWYPKMKPGAVFAGHDYFDGDLPGGDFGVRRAVDEFFGARGIPVASTFGDRPWLSWVVEVPKR